MVNRCQGGIYVIRNPSGVATTTPDKFTKASAKQRHGEVAKRNSVTRLSLAVLYANPSPRFLYFRKFYCTSIISHI